jgi:drug/metabolite transporter (DMT)-like permease
MPYLGEIAALTTAVCWTFTSILFTEAGRRIGSFSVNNVRLVFAVTIYIIIMLVTTGQIWPAEMNSLQFFWLALSALIGLVIGDGFGFKALVMIGPRLTTLMWSVAPIMVTVIAWFFLDESLSPIELIGIAITIAGIAWVVLERRYKNHNQFGLQHDHPDSGTLWKGVGYGLLAALGQGLGLILSKEAMLNAGGSLDPLPASYVRMLSAVVMIWIISGFRGRLRQTLRAFKDSRAMFLSAGGAFFGPFFGVWMSLVAVRMIEAGIAATLNAMTPIFVIPVVIVLYKEKVSLRAWLGAILAVGGVTLLFVGDELSRQLNLLFLS